MSAPGVSWGAPVIELRGERPGWQDWMQKTGDTDLPPAGLSFDSMEHAFGAARQGLGVALGSVALASADLASGRLIRLGRPDLEIRDGYWLT